MVRESGAKIVATTPSLSGMITRARSSTTETKLPLSRPTMSPPNRVIWFPAAVPVVRRPLPESSALVKGVWASVAGSSL